MAQLTQTPKSKSKRPRVQFSMNRELFTTYEQLQALAEEHRITIDFRRDFEEWFGNQLNQIMQQFAELDRKEDGGSLQSRSSHFQAEKTSTHTGEPGPIPPGRNQLIGHQASKAGDSFNGNKHSKNPIAGNRFFTTIAHNRQLENLSANSCNHSGFKKYLVGRSKIWTLSRPIKLGPRITAWRVEDIRNLISRSQVIIQRMNKMQLMLSGNDGMDKNHVQHPRSSKNQNDPEKSGGQYSFLLWLLILTEAGKCNRGGYLMISDSLRIRRKP